MLSIRGLTVRFGESPALDGVSVDAADGEIVALLGPSGCGKTTLLRAVAGLQEVSAGEVWLDGRTLGGVPIHRRGIGLMFQDYALFPHLDVAGNVDFGLRMRGDGPGRRQERVDEVLSLVGLEGFGPRSVATLSGGERQRVALARALAPSPSVLMLDEPLGALDRTLRERLVVELSELFARLQLTVLYVTHDQTEALALADRVVVMDHGRVAQQGTPEAVWAVPADAVVARFLGLTNIFEAEAAEELPTWLTSLTGWVPGEGPTTVLIRPEAVRLSRAGSPGAAAVVEATTFRGDHTQVWLRLGVDRLEARSGIVPRPQVGSEVAVSIDPQGVVPLGRVDRQVGRSTPSMT